MHRSPYDAIITTPAGQLGFSLDDTGRLTQLDWLRNRIKSSQQVPRRAAALAACLTAYFDTATSLPAWPLALEGTPFQRRVWQAMCRIPHGQTRTYGQLAAELGTASRAVGQACRRNPVVLFVPCHRVVAAHGTGGYMGRTDDVRIKEWLLAHERRQ